MKNKDFFLNYFPQYLELSAGERNTSHEQKISEGIPSFGTI